MPRGSDLIGLPVLAGPELKRIGCVQELLLSNDGTRVLGLKLDGGGWLAAPRVLAYEGVKAIGETYVLAEESYWLEEVHARPSERLHGLPVLMQNGAEVGTLDDFYFDAPTGRMTALQLSRGFVDDLLSGKSIVPLPNSITTGESAILLDGPGELPGEATF